MNELNRRRFLQGTALSLPAASLWQSHLLAAEESADLPPVRRITSGPKHHWFGYYDKLQFCPQNRLVLSNQVDFEHRSPKGDDVIQVGMVDTQNNNEWTELGETRAWCWQQGCMFQWLPGSENEVIWNDRDDGQYVSHIMDVQSGKRRTIPYAIYNVSPDGRHAIGTDFARLNDCRPGYGYAGIIDPNRAVKSPADSGLWLVDLKTGEGKLVYTLEQAVQLPFEGPKELAFDEKSKHWFNHLLFNTDGSRVWFLHRWHNKRGMCTRAFTINPDGSDPYILDPYGRTSHFIWRDPQHVMAWSWHPSSGSKFYLYKDKSEEVQTVGPDVMTHNGHNTYLPGSDGKWVLNDTYPDRNRLQHPYLYHIPSDRKFPLGHFKSPTEYRGEWRCDTHPRSSRDGRTVCVDSPHNEGRQLYLIDVSEIVESV